MQVRYTVRFDLSCGGGWEVYDSALGCAVFGSDNRADADNFAGERELARQPGPVNTLSNNVYMGAQGPGRAK